MPASELRSIPRHARHADHARSSLAAALPAIGELDLRDRLAAAEALARRSTERLALSHRLTDDVAAARNERELAAVAFTFAASVGAVGGVVTALTDDHLDVRHVFGVEHEPSTRLGATSPEARVLARGEPLWLDDGSGPSWIGVPLESERRLSGTLSFTFAPGVQYDDDARAFLASAIDCCGRALSRARLDASQGDARDAAGKEQEEARRLARLQEQLLAEVAHDLRTPITAIKLSVATLLAGCEITVAQSRKLARVDASIARMCEMLLTLSDFTQARLAGGIRLEAAAIDLGRLARCAAAEMEAAHPGRSIRLTVDGDVTVEAEDRRLMQVLSNLLGNAIQHGSGEAPVDVALRCAGETVVLQVHNDGPAIEPALLPDLFQPFRQGAASRGGAAQSGSLGLGLFIVHEVVRAHGGTVSVESTSDRGTTFTVELPRSQHPQGSRTTESECAPS